jgi:hypothetical protein
MRDLTDWRLMLLKAILFIAIGLLSAGMLFADVPTLRTALLLALCIWSFARAYYFAFYVIEKYIADPAHPYRYAGILSALRYLATRSGKYL